LTARQQHLLRLAVIARFDIGSVWLKSHSIRGRSNNAEIVICQPSS
jgi:hypothetical protein